MSDLSREYGGALSELAKDENLYPEILSDVRAVRAALNGNPDYVRFLTSPNIPVEERILGIGEVSKKAHPYVSSFLKLMTELGYGNHISEAIDEYERLYYKDNGIARADVESAVELTAVQQEKLKKNLERKTGKKIELNLTVNPSVIGGLRVTVEGERLEGSVRGKLEGIREKLANSKI